jgi:hypothetical protein
MNACDDVLLNNGAFSHDDVLAHAHAHVFFNPSDIQSFLQAAFIFVGACIFICFFP